MKLNYLRIEYKIKSQLRDFYASTAVDSDIIRELAVINIKVIACRSLNPSLKAHHKRITVITLAYRLESLRPELERDGECIHFFSGALFMWASVRFGLSIRLYV